MAASTALLTKAGYPNGFSVNVWTYNTPVFIDILSSFKADLAKVNINMTINGTDYASWVARFSLRNYGANDFLWTSTAGIGTYQRMINFRGSGTYNSSSINDATVEAAYQQMQQYAGVDEAKCQQINRDLMPYLLRQAYVIPVPVAYLYIIWWPWLNNYYGVQSVGYYESFGKYIWINEALRKQMTGQ